MIEKNNYVNYEKYKLNIKMPLIYVLKYYVVCMYLWHQFSREGKGNDLIAGGEDIEMYKVSEE